MENLEKEKKYVIFLNTPIKSQSSIYGDVLEINKDCVVLKTSSLTTQFLTLHIPYGNIAAFHEIM